MHIFHVFLFLVAMSTMILGLINNKKYTSSVDKPLASAHVMGVSGKKVSLPCNTQPLTAQDKVEMVLWFRETDGEPIYIYDVRGRSLHQPKFSSSSTRTRASFRATVRPATLILESVTSADTGIYRCRVDFQNSPSRNFRVNLTVITPPNRPTILDARTLDSSRLLEPYNEGDTIELLCEVYGGIPRPRLIWYLENTIIDESYEQGDNGVTSNKLTFSRVERQHLNARLICQASNSNLTAPQSKFMILDINLRPLSVQIIKKQGPFSANHSYEVECITTGSRPPAQITWFKRSKYLRKIVKNLSRSNSTRSVLRLVPEAQDHETTLICRAENPLLRASSLEDTWKLAVQYAPIVSLKIRSNMNSFHIAEGDDAYFECSARANPDPSKFLWFKQGKEIRPHNVGAEAFVSKQSMILQNVHRNDSGEYSCAAQNDEGISKSAPVNLQVRYPPVCISVENGQEIVVLETVELVCEVDSSPPPDIFMWSFNNSKEYMDIDPKYYKSAGSLSSFLYTPSTGDEFGVISCFALNSAGLQSEPCKFTLVAAALPTSLQNCSVVNQSLTDLQVECQEGFHGGLIQEFHVEVFELPSMTLVSNVTSNTSVLTVNGLPARVRAHYLLNLYASNAKGRSDISTLHTVISRNRYTESYSFISISPMLGSIVAIVALLTASVCAVLMAAYRRHVNRVKGPSNNSVDAFPERNDTYTGSPKIDYTSEFELKLDPNNDPDFISINCGKKIEEMKTFVDKSDTLKIYGKRGFNSTPTSYSISVVDRGVTARSENIAASYRSDIHESCI